MTSQERKRLSAAISIHGSEPLQDWLNRASAILPDDIREAISGIYCGRSGRIREPVDNGKYSLVMGWYEGKAEYAYIA